MDERARREKIQYYLSSQYPGSARELCALMFQSPFQLLVATILSAQCTDVRVNMVTPILFEKYSTPKALSVAQLEDVEAIIRSTGFYHNKANNLIAMAGMIVKGGLGILESMEGLLTLPGVGRKTANVVLSVAFGRPGLPVDTHVIRLSGRLGLTKETDPVRIETDLLRFVNPADCGALSLRLILHGRQICTARKPNCDRCDLASVCPSSTRPGQV